MGYKEIFTEEEILALEERLLKLMGKKREDFSLLLWEDFNFVYNALPYFDYKSNYWVLDEFISEKFYDNMLVVCAIIKNLRDVHNHIGVSYVLKNVPKHAWYEEKFMFLHNVVCADITALEFIPEELKTSDVIMNGKYQVIINKTFTKKII